VKKYGPAVVVGVAIVLGIGLAPALRSGGEKSEAQTKPVDPNDRLDDQSWTWTDGPVAVTATTTWTEGSSQEGGFVHYTITLKASDGHLARMIYEARNNRTRSDVITLHLLSDNGTGLLSLDARLTDDWYRNPSTATDPNSKASLVISGRQPCSKSVYKKIHSAKISSAYWPK
jgi:hypothetical protein